MRCAIKLLIVPSVEILPIWGPGASWAQTSLPFTNRHTQQQTNIPMKESATCRHSWMKPTRSWIMFGFSGYARLFQNRLAERSTLRFRAGAIHNLKRTRSNETIKLHIWHCLMLKQHFEVLQKRSHSKDPLRKPFPNQEAAASDFSLPNRSSASQHVITNRNWRTHSCAHWTKQKRNQVKQGDKCALPRWRRSNMHLRWPRG